ncbi:uncharacterized protein LOC143529887 [Bidens hawaiensis]|uniref:uncharacterized protein LOC143529887 n=1 Tax=Bidens hawaiensis TaxID=980011 RepID=UPI00404A0DD4
MMRGAFRQNVRNKDLTRCLTGRDGMPKTWDAIMYATKVFAATEKVLGQDSQRKLLSVKADKVYCLHCYLFKESGQNDAFLSEGLRCWNRCREKFSNHVGKCNSFHNKARNKGKDLLNQAQSVHVAIDKGTYIHKKEYRIRLHASARLTKALLNGSLAFRGHDESEESLYRGNFIEFLKVFGELSEEIGKVILGNAPGNNQMTSPSIQKELFIEEILLSS